MLKKRRRDHVTPLLKELHWLPVKFRCRYKIATLAYCHSEGSLPPYLSSSLGTYEPSRSLRSSNEKLLKTKAKSQIIWTTFFQFHYTISLKFSAGHSKKCTNTVSIQIAAKNLLACPGLPVESEEICVCVAVQCRWMDRERGKGRERA